MKAAELTCWKCGNSLEGQLLPLSRMATCKHCHTDLHACRQCSFYDTTVSNACREPVAERVTDKQRRNFCGYFQPSATAFQSPDSDRLEKTREQLDALFGIDNGSDTTLDREDEAAAAREKLEQLFRPKDDDQ